MKVTVESLWTGKSHTADLNITQAQFDEFTCPHRTRMVQDIFPNLTPDEREFLMTGAIPSEWEEMFGKPEDHKGGGINLL